MMGVPARFTLAEAAYHEAGHAVAALRHRWPLHDIVAYEKQRTFRPPEIIGYTTYGKYAERRPASEWAAVCLAGPIAQAVFRHRVHGERLDTAQRWVFDTNVGPNGDMTAYSVYRAEALEVGWPADTRKAVQMVRQLVIRDWERISRLADTVQQQSRLTSRQIRRVAA